MLARVDGRGAGTAPFALAPGSIVDGRYRIEERIGSGGMGIVYRADHLTLGASFAIKVLRPELGTEPAMVERLLLEARAASRIASDYVVPIVDAGSIDDGLPFLVMPLLVGEDLQALLARSERLPPVRAVNLGLDACRGLAAAHARGLVHRDLKPANLFVTRAEDGADRVKLLDFGIVKQVGHETTRPGSLVGTVRYMAPEQMGLDAPIGPATDVFALGVILYRCLAGDVPFSGDTTERIIFKTMTGDADPLSTRCPGLPDGLSDVIARSLAKQPADRYPTAAAFAEALLPFAGARRSNAAHAPSASLDMTLAEAPRERAPVARRPGASFRSGRSLPALGGFSIGAALALAVARVGDGRADATPTAADAGLPRASAAALTAAALASPPAHVGNRNGASAPALATSPETSTARRTPAASASATDRPGKAASSVPAVSADDSVSRATSGDGVGPAAGLDATARRKRAPASLAGSTSTSTEPRRAPPSPFFDPENPYAPRPQR
ncbi:MAG TPA: protein kinase [Polyangiaceae bacterium]|nr:protein kinase [Polyangiaceae bacterium]